jgi:metal-responsive CopG/Arc/MetJ family transcriptional regulator
MARSKLTVVMDEALIRELRKRVPRNRSRFISDAVRRELRILRDEELREAYSEAAESQSDVSADWDVVSGDGL